MNFRLIFTPEAHEQLERLRANPDSAARLKAVTKSLGYITILAITPHP